ncbi:MAG: hypothetical protein FWC50_03820 [Planctomycetaceae bacterium]|nr:hypothetical protein [Planctomycetaceae bacterium]
MISTYQATTVLRNVTKRMTSYWRALVTLVTTITVIGCSASFVFAGDFEPFRAVIAVDDAYLRSGPGFDFYPTTHMRKGDEVEVYSVYTVAGERWCAIRPPEGCFTWVDARDVLLGEHQVGTVLINHVAARVGSDMGNMCGAIQLYLNRNEKVFVLERIETPGDPETPVWYKIAPPAGEFRFIAERDIVAERSLAERNLIAESQNSSSPIRLVSNLEPRQPPAQTAQASRQTKQTVTPPQAVSRTKTAVSQVNSLPMPKNAETTKTFEKPPASPDNMDENSVDENSAIDHDDFCTSFEQLKVDLSDKLIEQETAIDGLQGLAHQARMLYQVAPTRKDRADVYKLIAGIERATRVRKYESIESENSKRDHETSKRESEPRRESESIDVNDGRRLALPRKEILPQEPVVVNTKVINTEPELEYPEHVPQYASQEEFHGNDIPQAYQQQAYRQKYQAYDENGRLMQFPNGEVSSDPSMESLVYDPNTGMYFEMPPGFNGRMVPQGYFPNQQPAVQNSSRKNWLQRLITGDIFEKTNPSASSSPNSSHPQTIPPQTQRKGLYTAQPLITASRATGGGYNPTQMSPYPQQFSQYGYQQMPQINGLPSNALGPGSEIIMYDEMQGVPDNSSQGMSQPVIQPVIQQPIVISQGQVPTMIPATRIPATRIPATNSDTANALVQIIEQPVMQTPQNHGITGQYGTTEQTMGQTTEQIAQTVPASGVSTTFHSVTGQLQNGVAQVSANAFDAIGRLGRVKNQAEGTPKYILVDNNGNMVCFVSQTPGADLESYVNQTIGVVGIKSSYNNGGNIAPHVAAKGVYPIVK